VLKSIKQRINVGWIFCDRAKAFDCVNHIFCKVIYIYMVLK
jgi:hypothetical protein